MWNKKVCIRILEVLLCIGCVVALRVTDDESRRVFHYLRNRSREWSSILNNVTWGAIGAALATVTCGGYMIICAGLLIAAATNEINGRKTEIFLLGLGIILFGIVGALSLASIESVPQDLIDNAAVLGALCLATALLFIADLLISPITDKKQQKTEQIYPQRDAVKREITTSLTSEKELSTAKTAKTDNAKKVELEEQNDQMDRNSRKETKDFQERVTSEDQPGNSERVEREEETGRMREVRAGNINEQEAHRMYGDAEEKQKEYNQNFENGRMQRDSVRYAELQKPPKDTYEIEVRPNRESKIVYTGHDIYQRPIDEIDTPLFPTTHHDNRSAPYFSKLVNPAVKIMRVDRDVQENMENYRYSDTSQYDNVPIRMRGVSSGRAKTNRDVSFNTPPPPKNGYGQYKSRANNADEIQMLQDCFGALRTTSIGTQTKTPSSPNDPGYVRHTASNWPQ